MKYTAKVTKVGDSLFVIVPANIKNLLNLNINDILEISINKYIEPVNIQQYINDIEEPEIVEYKCVCGHRYFLEKNTEDIYCPLCGEENKEKIKEVIEEINENGQKN